MKYILHLIIKSSKRKNFRRIYWKKKQKQLFGYWWDSGKNPKRVLSVMSYSPKLLFNPSCPDFRLSEKINLNFYFYNSLWCLKRFYGGFKSLHKTFRDTTTQCALWYQHPLLSCQAPPLNMQTVQTPFFRQSPLYIGFFWTPLKIRFFSEPPKYWSFSSLALFDLLKIAKFLVKIS